MCQCGENDVTLRDRRYSAGAESSGVDSAVGPGVTVSPSLAVAPPPAAGVVPAAGMLSNGLPLSPPPTPAPAPPVGNSIGGGAALGSPSGPDFPPRSFTDRIANKIQIVAAMMVTRVKVSPALVPNALWPPIPPKAPVSPPPRPRCTSTSRIRKSEMTLSKNEKRKFMLLGLSNAFVETTFDQWIV